MWRNLGGVALRPGSTSLGAGFEWSKSLTTSWFTPILPVCGLGCARSAAALLGRLPAAKLSAIAVMVFALP